VISGVSTGQHMYIETSKSTTTTTIAVQTAASTTQRRWNIRVDQIECSNPVKAPSGCTQYFTATSGVMTSYNWDTTTPSELPNQRMTLCVRPAANNCKIQYAATSSTSFIVGANIAAAMTTTCAIGAVYIPRAIAGTGWAGFVCQGTFSNTNAATVDSAIIQSAPFKINYKRITGVIAGTSGFSLNYAQQAC